IWNDRRIGETPFGRAYEELLLRYGTDYTRVKEAYPEALDMENFFGRGNFERRELGNFQEFDLAGLAGRLRSSSYAPRRGQPNYQRWSARLGKLFAAYSTVGRVRMEYSTKMFFGRLDAAGSRE